MTTKDTEITNEITRLKKQKINLEVVIKQGLS